MSGLIPLRTTSPATFDDPKRFLEGFHGELRRRIDAIDAALAAQELDRVRSGWHFFVHEARVHELDEEASVIPRLEHARLLSPADRARLDHDELGLMLMTLGEAVPHAPDDELALHAAAFVATYRDHLEHEEATLFAPMKELAEAERKAIGLEMHLRR